MRRARYEGGRRRRKKCDFDGRTPPKITAERTESTTYVSLEEPSPTLFLPMPLEYIYSARRRPHEWLQVAVTTQSIPHSTEFPVRAEDGMKIQKHAPNAPATFDLDETKRCCPMAFFPRFLSPSTIPSPLPYARVTLTLSPFSLVLTYSLPYEPPSLVPRQPRHPLILTVSKELKALLFGKQVRARSLHVVPDAMCILVERYRM